MNPLRHHPPTVALCSRSMPMERCRYCGSPTDRDDLQCEICAEYELIEYRDALRHEVERWALRIEGISTLGGRPIIDIEVQEGRL